MNSFCDGIAMKKQHKEIAQVKFTGFCFHFKFTAKMSVVLFVKNMITKFHSINELLSDFVESLNLSKLLRQILRQDHI